MNQWLWLFAAFAVGLIAMAAIGGSTGIFDSGPSEADVEAARESGRQSGRQAAEDRLTLEAERAERESFQAGQAAAPAPRPTAELIGLATPLSGLVTDTLRGRAELDQGLAELADQAYQQGYNSGYDWGASRAWIDAGRSN